MFLIQMYLLQEQQINALAAFQKLLGHYQNGSLFQPSGVTFSAASTEKSFCAFLDMTI